MLRLIGYRLLSTIPVLLIVSFVVFGLLALIPGDPSIALAGGPDATPESIAEVRQRLHLDDPLIVQYGRWLSGVVQGDLGNSLVTDRPVTEGIASRLPVTVGLALAATVVALLIAVPLGIVSGVWPGGGTDGLVRTLTSAGLAVPNFWLAVLLVSLFSVRLGWFSPTGYVSPAESFTGWLSAIALPAIALGVAAAASIARQLRRSLMEVLDSNYVRTAWAKGAGTSRVVLRHGLKNAAIPAVTILGIQIASLLGGAVIIEQIFSIPGLGTYMITGIHTKDLPVVQGVLLVFVLFQVLMSLVVDITYGYLNPKVRVV